MSRRIIIFLCFVFCCPIVLANAPDYAKALFFDHAGEGGFCVDINGRTICSIPKRAECELGEYSKGVPFGYLNYKLWFRQPNGKYALYGYKGILGQWDEISPASSAQYFHSANFCFVCKSGTKWGVLNKDGKVVIPPQYDDFIYSDCCYPENHIIVKKGKYWGVIDGDENVLIPFNYDSILGTYGNSKSYFSVKQNKWGLINAENTIVLPCEYDEPIDISKWDDVEMVIVVKNGKKGCLNKDGKIVLSCKYNEIYFYNQYIDAKIGPNNSELLDISGKLLKKGYIASRILGDKGLFVISENNGNEVIVLENLHNGQIIQTYKGYKFEYRSDNYAGDYFALRDTTGHYWYRAFNLKTGEVVPIHKMGNYSLSGFDMWGHYALFCDNQNDCYIIWDLINNKTIKRFPKTIRDIQNFACYDYQRRGEKREFSDTYLHYVTRRELYSIENFEYKDFCTIINHRGDIILPERPISDEMRYNPQIFGGVICAVRWADEKVSRIYDNQGNILYTGDFHHISYEWKDKQKGSMWLLLEKYTGNKYDDRNVQYGYCLYENNVITEVVSCNFRRGDAERFLCQYLAEQSKRIEDVPNNNKPKSDIDFSIPIVNTPNSNTIALIIANEKYTNMPYVPYALNDGNIFKEYCTKTLGIPEENILYQTNATLNGIRQKIDLLQKKAQARANARKETNIIVYYTGHGVPDINTRGAYLMPTDGYEENISTGYKLDDLYQQLGKLPAKSITVFLDACFSGVNRNDEALAQNKGARLVAKSGMPTGNMVVFAASQGNQTAFVNDQEQHGLFTYYLLKKLQDTKGDVTLEELANYLMEEVNIKSLNLHEKEQIPSIIASPQVSNQWQNWKLK